MKITLISDDRNLYELCRDTLGDARAASCTLSVVASDTDRPEADFYICDVNSKPGSPAYAQLDPASCLFIVDRLDLDRFRKSAPGTATNILLKPLTRAALAVFLDLVCTITGQGVYGANRDSPVERLLQTNLRLQKSDQERSAFLASVAHDLRAPVTGLLGYCGLLLDHHPGSLDESQRTILRHMQNSASRLSRMASAIFDLSVELQSAHNVDFQAGDLLMCVGQARHEIALIAADKRIQINVKIESFDNDLYFDPALIERVLINILENACRFTPRQGKIEVRGYPFFWERRNRNAMIPTLTERRSSVAHAPNCYRVDICNAGPGIPPELLEYIFEQYVSLDPNHRQSGCGLGLAICRTIIARHRGRIWAQNTESGPLFSFVLPGGRPVSQPATGMASDQRVNDAMRLTNTHAAIQ